MLLLRPPRMPRPRGRRGEAAEEEQEEEDEEEEQLPPAAVAAEAEGSSSSPEEGAPRAPWHAPPPTPTPLLETAALAALHGPTARSGEG